MEDVADAYVGKEVSVERRSGEESEIAHLVSREASIAILASPSASRYAIIQFGEVAEQITDLIARRSGFRTARIGGRQRLLGQKLKSEALAHSFDRALTY